MNNYASVMKRQFVRFSKVPPRSVVLSLFACFLVCSCPLAIAHVTAVEEGTVFSDVDVTFRNFSFVFDDNINTAKWTSYDSRSSDLFIPTAGSADAVTPSVAGFILSSVPSDAEDTYKIRQIFVVFTGDDVPDRVSVSGLPDGLTARLFSLSSTGQTPLTPAMISGEVVDVSDYSSILSDSRGQTDLILRIDVWKTFETFDITSAFAGLSLSIQQRGDDYTGTIIAAVFGAVLILCAVLMLPGIRVIGRR